MTRDADDLARQAVNRGADALAAKLRGIATQAKATRSTGLHLPTLDADPEPDNPTNLWLLEDGRLRSRTADGTTHEYVPTGEAPVGGDDTTGGGTSTKPKPADTAPTRHRKTYSATWGRCFCERHGVETGANLRYGRYDGTHGERRIMLGFNDAAIRADLDGATIRQVELRLWNTDSWAYSGIDISFGAHNRDAAPSSFSAVRRNVWTGRWPKWGTGKEWRSAQALLWIGRAFRDNDVKGITVDQPATITRYGELDWSSCKLRITYTS